MPNSLTGKFITDAAKEKHDTVVGDCYKIDVGVGRSVPSFLEPTFNQEVSFGGWKNSSLVSMRISAPALLNLTPP